MDTDNEVIDDAEGATDTDVDFSAMTDDEIANFDISDIQDDVVDADDDSDNTDPEVNTNDEQNEKDTEKEEDNKEEENEEVDDVTNSDDNTDDVDGDTDSDGDSDADSTDDKDETSLSDAEAQVKEILSPFKANGREIKVDSIEDARTLMQMGANYNKKMHSIKPHLKLIKMLENNDLLEETRLANLIDLSKKNPDAIKKLVKESGIDPLELNNDEDTNYQPNTYTVDDKEIDLDNALSEISDSKSFDTTVDIINNKWDDKSKAVLIEQPEIIKVINEHVALGVYEQISTIVERERMLGRLSGLSDLEAYKHVGDALQSAEAFEQQKRDKSSNSNSNANTNTASKKKLKDRKRSASPTQSATNTPADNGKQNMYAISDEDFAKLPSSQYM